MATKSCSSPCSAAARLAALNSDGSVASDYALKSAAGFTNQLAVSSMLFKVMDHAQRSLQPVLALQGSPQALYSIQWVTSSPGSSAHGQQIASHASMQLRTGRLCKRLPKHAVSAAAAVLASLQQAAADSGTVCLLAPASTAGLSSCQDPAGSNTAAAAACTGLLRVAARERPSASISHLLTSPLARQQPQLPQDLQADAFGLAATAGTWQAPLLVPTADQPACPVSGSLQSCLIMGGTGDIGSLVGLYACSSAAAVSDTAAAAAGPSSSLVHTVLAGRSGRAVLPWLAHPQLRAEVTLVRCDGSSAQEVHDLSLQLRAQQAGPVQSTVQAGGIVRDAALSQQTAASLRAVMAPKAGAAGHLAAAQWALPVAASLAFSSLSALLGTPGQANYAAANSVLDAAAQHAEARGELLHVHKQRQAPCLQPSLLSQSATAAHWYIDRRAAKPEHLVGSMGHRHGCCRPPHRSELPEGWHRHAGTCPRLMPAPEGPAKQQQQQQQRSCHCSSAALVSAPEPAAHPSCHLQRGCQPRPDSTPSQQTSHCPDQRS